MFTERERDDVRERLIALAREDPEVVGAALTGSAATGEGDRWSDTDLVLAVREPPGVVAERWTRWIEGEFGVRHQWDLATAPSVVRVFLLPGWLEIDLTFAPEEEFGARGSRWKVLFGRDRVVEPFGKPDPGVLAGMVWHHALHARICLERGRAWQAEHWISAMRDHAITLACLRLGLPASYAKGAHLLPGEVTGGLAATLVRDLSDGELKRALGAAVAVAESELRYADPGAAQRLAPMFAELTR